MSVQVGFIDHLLKYEEEIISRLAKKESLVVLAAGLSVEEWSFSPCIFKLTRNYANSKNRKFYFHWLNLIVILKNLF